MPATTPAGPSGSLTSRQTPRSLSSGRPSPVKRTLAGVTSPWTSPARVHRRQRARQRHRDRDDLARTQPAGGEQAGQAATAAWSSTSTELVSGADNGAQPHDVGMVDAGQRGRLAAQPVPRREIARRAQPLERHRLTARRLAGQPHLTARAEPEQLDHVVAGHLPARRRAVRWRVRSSDQRAPVRAPGRRSCPQPPDSVGRHEDPRDVRRLPPGRDQSLPPAARAADRARHRAGRLPERPRICHLGDRARRQPHRHRRLLPRVRRLRRARVAPRAVPDAQRARHARAPARAGRDLGRRRLGRQPARGLAGARPRRDHARVLGGRRRARRRLGGLDLLARRRHHRLASASSCGRSPTVSRCSPTATACTTTPRSSAVRCCTGWSPTARCRTSYATDDGVGLHYDGTELVEAVADRPGAAAYKVERGADGQAVETRIEPRLLPGAD